MLFFLLGLAIRQPQSTLGAPVAEAQCRCRPSDPCWPSSSDWGTLNRTVHGRLIVPVDPVASKCAAGRQTQACREALNATDDQFFLVSQPGGFEKGGWVGAFNTSQSSYAVAAESPEDVAAAVRFANDHSLRLVVKNTGHDYLGRSMSSDSLMIWVRPMQELEFDEHFQPAGCDGTSLPVVHIGAGKLWYDVYHAVIREKGRYIVGGTCSTVGASGGFWQGGGYSDRTKQYASAAANVVEAEVVLADGSVVVANECSHKELFWALRGGGGGTYGVVTRTTMRTHELPSRWGSCEGATIKAEDDPSWKQAVAVAVRLLNQTMSEFGWGRDFMAQWDPPTKQRSLIVRPTIVTTVGSPHTDEEYTQALQPIYDFARNHPKLRVEGNYSCHTMPSMEWWDPVANPGEWHPSLVPGKFKHMTDHEASSFILAEASHYVPFDDPDRVADAVVRGAKMGFPIVMQLEKGMAGVPADAMARQKQTSMHPGALQAGGLITWNWFTTNWHPPVDGTIPPYADIARGAVEGAADIFRAEFPSAGSYANEGSFFEPNWQESQWGSNYPRLLDIKTKVDPGGLFVCHHCVGSEAWSVDGFCKLN